MSENHNGSKSVAISLFLQSLKKQKVSESTLKAYNTDLSSFFGHLQLKSESLDVSSLERLQPQDVESYLKSMAARNLKFATIKRNVATIRRFFSFLVEQGIIANDPVKSLTVRPVDSSALTSEQVLSLFEYLIRREEMGNELDTIRYRRDELILLFLIFYGVRQYQLSSLKLSQLQMTGKSVSLTVKRGLTIRLDGVVLEKLRIYLSLRKSNADTIFLEPLRKKPVDHSIMRTVLTELSYALRIECTPRSLFDTHLHLQRNPDEHQRLLERISSRSLSQTYAVAANA